MHLRVLVLVGVALSTAAASPSREFDVDVFQNGSYSILFRLNWIETDAWINSGPVLVMNNNQIYTSDDGSLKLLSFKETSSGQEGPFGYFRRYTWQWASADGTTQLVTEIDKYYNIALVVFRQVLGSTLTNTGGSPNGLASSFPSFWFSDSQKERGWMTYSGNMGATMHFGIIDHLSEVYGGLNGGFPLVTFSRASLDTVVISPLGHYMDVNQASWKTSKGSSVFGFGPIGSMQQIPAGETFETVLFASNGIVDTILEWGGLLRQYHGKTDTLRMSDSSINYLGYWTDNGACYYYYTGNYSNYEDALVAVKNYADQEGIPLCYLQIDSWWYFRGYQGGVKNWTAMPSVFPNGIEAVVKKTGWPIVAHNRYWSNDTDYATQNGGQYSFILDNGVGIPTQQAFWDFLLSSSKKQWGLMVYEQDWLDYTEEFMTAVSTNYDLARTWLLQMGQGAKDNDLTIQYCMPWPRHYLQSLEVSTVTQTRISDDYHPGNTQWNIGDTVILAEAMGLAAFKDTFHTETEETVCKFTEPEPYPELETVSAALAGGPIGPGDSVSQMNKTLILSTCMSNGLLLKATRPAMSLDATFINRAFGGGGADGKLWASYTVVGDLIFYMVLGAELTSSYTVSLGELPPPPSGATKAKEYVAFRPSFSGKVTAAMNVTSLAVPACGRADYQYWVLAPVKQDKVVFLGEMGKVVSLSETRFKSIAYTAGTVNVKMAGRPGEMVTVAATIESKSMEGLQYFTCMIPSSGMVTLSLPSGTCTS